jgi:hypothetical protein
MLRDKKGLDYGPFGGMMDGLFAGKFSASEPMEFRE